MSRKTRGARSSEPHWIAMNFMTQCAPDPPERNDAPPADRSTTTSARQVPRKSGADAVGRATYAGRVDLFATQGLIQTLRSAANNTVVPVRVVRDTERTGAVGLRPLVEAPNAAPQSGAVVRFSSRALQLARDRAEVPAHERSAQREPPPRGQRLDVVA